MKPPITLKWYDARLSSMKIRLALLDRPSRGLWWFGYVPAVVFGPGLIAGLASEGFESELVGCMVAAPCYLVSTALILWGWPAVLFEGKRRRLVRAGENPLFLETCWNCRYSLAGLDSPVCPECGNSRVLILDR